ncbi:MAG: DUF3164 family protein [Pseudomonadota bacterium]
MATETIGDKEYMRDPRGALIPIEVVRPIDKLRDETVDAVFAELEAFREQQRQFVARLNDKVNAFLALEAQEYGAERTEWKGNLRLTSYDGLRRIDRVISDRITLSETLQIAVTLINELVEEWSEGARAELVALLKRALRTDEAGHYNTAELLALRSLEINDDRWARAMRAIQDAITVEGVKVAVRFGKREEPNGKFSGIPLDMSDLWG